MDLLSRQWPTTFDLLASSTIPYPILQMQRTRSIYGLWLLSFPRSFQDSRIWREDQYSNELQTQFQRKVGVRYVGRQMPRIPDSSTGFGSWGRRGPPRSVLSAFRRHFSEPLGPQYLSLIRGHQHFLRNATGYALVSSRHLRRISIHGAHYVGTIRVRD